MAGADWLNEFLVHDVVYWAPSGMDAYGSKVFASPVDVRARWFDKQSVVRDGKGEEVVAEATCRSGVQMQSGGLLWRGKIEDLSAGQLADPLTIPGAGIILTATWVADLTGQEYYGRAWTRKVANV